MPACSRHSDRICYCKRKWGGGDKESVFVESGENVVRSIRKKKKKKEKEEKRGGVEAVFLIALIKHAGFYARRRWKKRGKRRQRGGRVLLRQSLRKDGKKRGGE